MWRVTAQRVGGPSPPRAAAEVFVLFVSRFVYNMIALGSGNVETWGYRWTFLSDHVRAVKGVLLHNSRRRA